MAASLGVNMEKEIWEVSMQLMKLACHIHQVTLPTCPQLQEYLWQSYHAPLSSTGTLKGFGKGLREWGQQKILVCMKQWGEKEMEIGKLTKLSYQKKEGFHRGVQQKIRYWQRLATSPARSNESIIMELSWA